MAAIVLEGAERVPVRYADWDAWRDDLAATEPGVPLIMPGTRSCALCWGSGRIHRQAANGEGLVPSVCEDCGGGGLVLA
jgi:hypothetical protein